MKKAMLGLVLTITAVLSGNLQAQQTIVETAISAGNFKTLVAAVTAADLVDTLNGSKQFTVFAPTDEAFAKLAPETIQNLLKPENKAQLSQILTYHVLPGRVAASAAYDLNSAATVNGQRLAVDFRGDGLKIGEATITVTDIECSNGIIHVIDSVLLPKMDSIPATAKAAGQFNTLLAAVDAAGLADVLSGPGPFTVFAPTDDAFKALPAGTVESLLKPENKQQLVDILKYHVVSGRIYDNDAVKAGRAKTLLGRSVQVGLSANGISINESSVVAKNIDATNGVVHVIDAVLIPSAMSSQDVRKSISAAIERGVPVYNNGHHQRCCNIYMQTMESIEAAGIEGADSHTMQMVTTTLNAARHTHNMSDRAWVLRRGMDSLYQRVGRMNVPMTSSTR